MKCFVDTTVLTDALLGDRHTRDKAQSALKLYEAQLVPEYAHKEFKIGPLKHFYWFYRTLAETKSLVSALAALQGLSRTLQRYKTSTAIQALRVARQDLLGHQLGAADVSPEEDEKREARMYELTIKRRIITAWNSRSQVGELIQPLDCYPRMQIDADADPITTLPDNCPLKEECCLRNRLSVLAQDIGKLRKALNEAPSKRENVRRNAALKQLQKKPNDFFGRQHCRNLGDAYFVLTCPSNCTILTTNRTDFRILAAALQKQVSFP